MNQTEKFTGPTLVTSEPKVTTSLRVARQTKAKQRHHKKQASDFQNVTIQRAVMTQPSYCFVNNTVKDTWRRRRMVRKTTQLRGRLD